MTDYAMKAAGYASEYRATALPRMLRRYADYIENQEPVRQVYNDIAMLEVSGGETKRDETGWMHRAWTIRINGFSFPFKTGMGLNYSKSELIFNAVDCFLHESQDAVDYTLGCFLNEFGYCDNGKDVERGIEAYKAMKETRTKTLSIWSKTTIHNYCETVNL